MAATEAFYSAFQPGPLGQRFCLWHADPAHAPGALVVHVHAFAEEMNKSRRMAALQSRALAAAGAAATQAEYLVENFQDFLFNVHGADSADKLEQAEF